MNLDAPHPSEHVVIGRAVMHAHEQPDVVARLTELDFIDPLARSVFAAIRDAQDERTPFDPSMLRSLHLGVEEMRTISSWTEYAVDSQSLAWHVNALRDVSTRRKLRLVADRIGSAAADAETASDALAQSQADLTGLAVSARSGDEERTIAEILTETVERAVNPGDFAPMRIDSGIWSFDNVGNGLPRHGLVVLAGRPGMGKSCAAVTLAASIARQDASAPVVFFTPEMSRDQVVTVLLSQASGVPHDHIVPRAGSTHLITDDEVGALMAHSKSIEKLPIRVSGQVRVGPHDVRAHCLSILSEPGVARVSAVFVDYLQILDLSAGSRRNGSREDQEYSWASRELKLLSRELECPVFLVSQINRKVEERTDRRPRLSDLKGSGGIEENADMVVFFYRPAYYGPDAVNGDVVDELDEWIIAKNRGGPLGVAEMRFTGRCVRWESM